MLCRKGLPVAESRRIDALGTHKAWLRRYAGYHSAFMRFAVQLQRGLIEVMGMLCELVSVLTEVALQDNMNSIFDCFQKYNIQERN